MRHHLFSALEKDDVRGIALVHPVTGVTIDTMRPSSRYAAIQARASDLCLETEKVRVVPLLAGSDGDEYYEEYATTIPLRGPTLSATPALAQNTNPEPDGMTTSMPVTALRDHVELTQRAADVRSAEQRIQLEAHIRYLETELEKSQRSHEDTRAALSALQERFQQELQRTAERMEERFDSRLARLVEEHDRRLEATELRYEQRIKAQSSAHQDEMQRQQRNASDNLEYERKAALRREADIIQQRDEMRVARDAALARCESKDDEIDKLRTRLRRNESDAAISSERDERLLQEIARTEGPTRDALLAAMVASRGVEVELPEPDGKDSQQIDRLLGLATQFMAAVQAKKGSPAPAAKGLKTDEL